jgi:hypothetical protein
MERILFMPLTKVVELDDGTVEVWGRAAAEEPDPKKEIMDYAESKPLIKAWSDNAFQASGGKSLGNLRAMHNPRVAAGIVTSLNFLDDEKAIDAVAKVVDAEEVKKVRAGVYTGFSIGGSYARKWQDGDYTRYAAQPSELSLADNPMIKSARFTLVKVDGSEEQKEFTQVMEAGALQKRLNDVAQMAFRLYDLRCLLGNVVYEAEEEKDGSSVPARLQKALLDLVEIFKAFAAEEAEEMAANVRALLEQPVEAMAMNQGPQAGTPAPLNKVDYSQAATPAPQGGSTQMATLEQLEGLVKGLGERLEKVEGAFNAQGEQLAKVEAENAALTERLAKVEAEPAPAKGALKAVDRGDDVQPLAKTDGPTQDEMLKNKDTQGLIKAAHANPISLG